MTLEEIHKQLETKQRVMTHNRFLHPDYEVEFNGELIKVTEELKELREKYKNVSESFIKVNNSIFDTKMELDKVSQELEVYKKALELMSEELASNKHCTRHPYCYIKEDEEDCQLIEECHNSKWLFEYYLQKARNEE